MTDEPPAPFAKLFDTPDGQLLAFLDSTDDYEPAIKVIAAAVNGVVPSATLSGWTDGEQGQQRAFTLIDQAAAEHHAKALRNVVRDMATPD